MWKDQDLFPKNKMERKKKSEENFIDEFTKEMIYNTRLKIEAEKNKPKKIIIKEEPKKIIEKIEIRSSGAPPQIQAKPVAPPVQPAPIQKPIFRPAQASVQTPAQTPIFTPQTKPFSQQKPIIKETPIKNIPIPPKPQLQPGEIDFGKILFLIRDQLVTSIECPGVNKNIIIKKAGNIIKTQILLEKEEIMSVIKTFSEKAKIPLVEGMLVARVDNLEISGVIPTSTSASPSFIIKKEPVNFQNRQPTQLMRPQMQTTPAQPQRPIPFVPPQNPLQAKQPPQPNSNAQNLPNR